MVWGTWMVATTGFKPTYALHLGALTAPGYAALYSLIGNFVVCIVLTFVFRLMKTPAGADATSPGDYVYDPDESELASGAVAGGAH
jgi:SSS family solute:Na+ symporter